MFKKMSVDKTNYYAKNMSDLKKILYVNSQSADRTS